MIGTVKEATGRRFGRYEAMSLAGAGGMATVHLGRFDQDGTTRRVALKRLHDFIAIDPINVGILLDEARLLSCIRHPNIVRVLDLVEDPGSAPTLVMEWIDGTNLSTIAGAVSSTRDRLLPLDVVVAILRDILSGLHAAHEATRDDGLPLEIVHRDVSPQNVLVGVDGIARLTDFGIAKAAWRTQATEAGAIKGKLGYMSPEQLDGRADRRADIYSAGVILWELLTGCRLRSADGVSAQVLVQILHGIASAPSDHEPRAAILDDIVMRALARDPHDRFATALEMLELLVARVTPASPERVAAVLSSLMGGQSDDAAPSSPSSAIVIRRAPQLGIAARAVDVGRPRLRIHDLGLRRIRPQVRIDDFAQPLRAGGSPPPPIFERGGGAVLSPRLSKIERRVFRSGVHRKPQADPGEPAIRAGRPAERAIASCRARAAARS